MDRVSCLTRHLPATLQTMQFRQGSEMSAAHPMTDELLVTYTLFPTVWPTTKTERADVPWGDLVANIHKAPTYIDKGHCPLISMAEYGDLLSNSEHPILRHAANIRRIFGIEIDYDGEKMPIEEAAALMARADMLSVLYTSPSHTEAAPRWRVLLPLSEPAIPEKREEYVARVNRILGGVATRESFTLSQSFYIGRVRDVNYVVIETEGRCIDLAADIEPMYFVGGKNTGESARDLTTDQELRDAFIIGSGRYEAMLKLSSRWASRGMAQDDIAASLHALLDRSGTALNADGTDLRTRVEPLANSAFRKFGDSRAPRSFGTDIQAPAMPPGIEEICEDAPTRQPIDWPALEGLEPPPRVWRIGDWLTTGPTIFAGNGGIGKTLLAQMIATALVLQKNFVEQISAPVKVLFWACEDERDELWRRQIHICKYFGATLSDLKGKLIIEPRLGFDNALFTQVFGKPAWTDLRKELREQVNDYGADVLFLDNIAQTYGANENDRHHVTSFVNGMIGLAPHRPFSPILMGHPSRGPGSEFSGSSAWENAVRMRWYMGATLPDKEPKDDEEQDPNVRYLSKRKTNYSVKDYRKLIYENHVFQPEKQEQGLSSRYNYKLRKDAALSAVVFAVRKFNGSNIRVVEAGNSSDNLIKKMKEAKLLQDYTNAEINEAVTTLRMSGRLIVGKVGTYGNRSPMMGLFSTEP